MADQHDEPTFTFEEYQAFMEDPRIIRLITQARFRVDDYRWVPGTGWIRVFGKDALSLPGRERDERGATRSTASR